MFQDSKKKISSHFVIDKDGKIYKLLPCMDEQPLKAFHAGKSFWTDSKQKKWEEFNNISLGIELINPNGNIFPYTQAQYQALADLIIQLKKHYPSLRSPDRILGHEHIAGFRGKVDPGHRFQWNSFFKQAYPENSSLPRLKAVLSEELLERFNEMVRRLPKEEKNWTTLNTLLEKQHRHDLKTRF